MKEIPPWHHGSIGWSCSTDKPTPLSSFPKKRLRTPIVLGVHKGRTAVHAPCPKCKRKGRTIWVRIDIVD